MDDEDREIAMDELSDWNSDDSDDDEVEWHLGQMRLEEEEDTSGEESEDLLEEERRCAQRGIRRGRGGGHGARGRSRTSGPSCQDIDRLWQRNDPTTKTKSNPHPFTGVPGMNQDYQLNDITSVLEHFELFIDNNVIQSMCTQTNLYVEQFFLAFPAKKKPNQTWKDVEVPEFKRFLALLFLMGIVEKPTIKSYWSTDREISTPFFNSIMSCTCFYQLLAGFHLNDNT